jgi:carboxymethylenebutenolidase
VAGFLALAPDGLSPIGGYPGNDDDGRAMQSQLDPVKLRQDMINSGRYVKAHPLSTGKLGAVGSVGAAAWSISSPSRSVRI